MDLYASALNNCELLLLNLMFKCLTYCFLGEEIPVVVVPDISVLQPNADVTISCNLTERGSNKAATPLKRISWFKDGELLESVRNPDPENQKDTLGPLKIERVSIRDGGKYTCLLEVLLRNVLKYNVSDDTVIHSKYNAHYLLNCTYMYHK